MIRDSSSSGLRGKILGGFAVGVCRSFRSTSDSPPFRPFPDRLCGSRRWRSLSLRTRLGCRISCRVRQRGTSIPWVLALLFRPPHSILARGFVYFSRVRRRPPGDSRRKSSRHSASLCSRFASLFHPSPDRQSLVRPWLPRSLGLGRNLLLRDSR